MKSKTSLEEILYQSEDRLLNPEVRSSREELTLLLAEDFVEFGSSGQIWNKSRIIEALIESTTELMQIIKFQTKALAPDVALVTYCIIKNDEFGKERKDSLRSSVWKQIDGRWQMIFHQGTKIPAQ